MRNDLTNIGPKLIVSKSIGPQFIGSEGIADSQLRPGGFVKIDGRRMDAIAEGELIHPGARVRVVDAYDNQLKARPLDPPPSED